MAKTEHQGETRSSYRDDYTRDSPAANYGATSIFSCQKPTLDYMFFVLTYYFTLCSSFFAYRSTRTV
jgi:hypothetical protein